MDRKRIEEICRLLAESIIKRLPKGVGMALILYDFGEKGNLAYMSNGNRQDMIATLTELLEHIKNESIYPDRS